MNDLRKLLSQIRTDTNDKVLKKKIRELIANNPDDESVQKHLEEHWNELSGHYSPDTERRLELVLQQIHKKADIRPAKTEKRKIQMLIYKTAGIAASILFVIFCGLMVYNNKINPDQGKQIVQTTDKEYRQIQLPDGTEVWLNSQSSLKYSEKFDKLNERRVVLSGQAYFKVHHDKKHPFIVQTYQMDIKVLGTSFDVSAYVNDDIVRSTLVEGSISVLDKKGKELEKLKPGEQITFQRGHQDYVISKVKTDDFTHWKEGQMTFRDESIIGVARILERRYNCHIIISPELTEENPIFNFTVSNEELNEICKLIALASNSKVEISGDSIVKFKKNNEK